MIVEIKFRFKRGQKSSLSRGRISRQNGKVVTCKDNDGFGLPKIKQIVLIEKILNGAKIFGSNSILFP